MKVIRLLILLKSARIEPQRQTHHNAVLSLKSGGRVISENTRVAVLGFFFVFVSVYVVGTLLVAMSNVGIVTAALAAAATLNNIGPGLELVGATLNYARINDYGKIVLISLMVLGRLELFTILVLFTRRFWRP